MEWLASGLRRDVCILLYGRKLRVQRAKSLLESRYGRRIAPDRFHGAITALEQNGYVEKRVDGLHDVCSLTEAGRKRAMAQYEWMQSRIEAEDSRTS